MAFCKNHLQTESESPLTQEVAVKCDDGEEFLTMKEVAKHRLSQDAWVVINGNVYE